MAFKVNVDRKKCNGCEECLEACTVGLFQMKDGKAMPSEDAVCMGCETCMAVCDENAITVKDTRVALSNTCMSLLSALDEIDETENRRSKGVC
jgi:NAD-dependent dihydropyrimidine dehydrogenase PreA subunit